MTIDAFDWLHRTGANPPNEPVPGDNCTSAPARPVPLRGRLRARVPAPARVLRGPGRGQLDQRGPVRLGPDAHRLRRPGAPITDVGFDSHTQCFLGWLGVQTPANPNPRAGGPENSLKRWGDQGDGEILCDYGAAYSMMEFLAGRYGTDFMTALHRSDANGLRRAPGGPGTRAIRRSRRPRTCSTTGA